MKTCARCGGFLIIENWLNCAGDLKQRGMPGTRCVNCGSIDDPVIIQNRRLSYHTSIENGARPPGRPKPSFVVR